VRILQRGGELDEGSYIIRVAEHGFPPLTPSTQPYLLFLTWTPALDALQVLGPDATYYFRGPTVTSHGRSAVARQLTSMTPEQLLGTLRTMAKAQQ
jgi:hypothetical protein